MDIVLSWIKEGKRRKRIGRVGEEKKKRKGGKVKKREGGKGGGRANEKLFIKSEGNKICADKIDRNNGGGGAIQAK